MMAKSFAGILKTFPEILQDTVVIAVYEPISSVAALARFPNVSSTILATLDDLSICAWRTCGRLHWQAPVTPSPRPVHQLPAYLNRDEDLPDDTGFVNEYPHQENEYLSLEADSMITFQGHVTYLLTLFGETASYERCSNYVSDLPSTCPHVLRLGPRATLAQLKRSLQCIRDSHITGTDSLNLVLPFWLCHDYRLSVLTEAASRCTGIPTLFYIDSFRCCAMGLIHKNASVYSQGYDGSNRPWAWGVGDPSTSKSHAADPLNKFAVEVCKENSEHAVAMNTGQYHILKTRTYAALQDKYNTITIQYKYKYKYKYKHKYKYKYNTIRYARYDI